MDRRMLRTSFWLKHSPRFPSSVVVRRGAPVLQMLRCLVLVAAATWTNTSIAAVDFETDVLPIFEANCATCHGALQQESNYRLDLRESALGVADFGEPAIVPGNADESPLIRYVSQTSDDGIIMPPKDGGKPLSKEQVATLREWINEGATWPDNLAGQVGKLETDHWSFQPLRDVKPPTVSDAWVQNPIDAFVWQRLSEKQLQPSGPAPRAKLIRRLYLVMLGLPPTPEETESFIADTAPDAYERLVDRVLNSPHYGERWARHWLDVVRFAETNGFETNRERPTAYHFRDYVIESFNNDTPYDQFVREQIAGDALGRDVGTGFLVAGPYDIVKSPDINLTLMQRQDELADMVNTTGTTFLGLTIGCARCHSHKFDPIPQTDYYALQAVFAGVQHGERPLPDESERLMQRSLALKERTNQLDREFAPLFAKAKQLHAGPGNESAAREPVNAKLNEESFDPVEATRIRFTINATSGGSEPCLDEIEVYTADGTNVALASAGTTATASGTISGYAIHKLEHVNDGQIGNPRSWISNTADHGWVELSFPQPYVIERIVWARDRNGNFGDRIATDYRIEAANESEQWQTIASSNDRQPYGGQIPRSVILASLPDPERTRAIELDEQIRDLEQQSQQLYQDAPKAWIGTFQQPPLTYRLHRGDPMAKREEVAPDSLTVFGSLELSSDTAEQQRRLALANALIDPDVPLTSRVIVNRIWHYVFGTGLVNTPSDLGTNGGRPSHPDLLDYLAKDLIRNGWSLKHLQRTIALSATFQQDSTPRQSAMAVDAAAQFLWRFPPRRLEAESIRDSMLLVSGSLNRAMGGPGFSAFKVEEENVRHYFPRERWGENEWRRMVYMTKVRQEQDSVFGTFDCPDGNQTVPKRSRSTTPLQALNLFNSKFVLQQCDQLAERTQQSAGDDPDDQVAWLFRQAFNREPSTLESDECTAFIREHGLPSMCRVLFNANEFLFVF